MTRTHHPHGTHINHTHAKGRYDNELDRRNLEREFIRAHPVEIIDDTDFTPLEVGELDLDSEFLVWSACDRLKGEGVRCVTSRITYADGTTVLSVTDVPSDYVRPTITIGDLIETTY